MMYLETPPKLIETKIFSAMPDNFRRKGVATEWADANRPCQPTDSFIEGPSFDAQGNLYIVDIPFGRIFRIAQTNVTQRNRRDRETPGYPSGDEGRKLGINPDGHAARTG